MLRGIDARTARGDDAVIVKVTDRADLTGEITVYVREDSPAYVQRRQRNVREVFDTLTAAGVLDPVSVVEWPERVVLPNDDIVAEVYERFVEAVGRNSLEPFFERKAATGSDEYVVALPPVCIALRDDDAVRGLYPCWQNGTHHSIENCITALSRGEPIANLDS
jgi:hypothetical protein